jgi:hypothetical protein
MRNRFELSNDDENVFKCMTQDTIKMAAKLTMKSDKESVSSPKARCLWWAWISYVVLSRQ